MNGAEMAYPSPNSFTAGMSTDIRDCLDATKVGHITYNTRGFENVTLNYEYPCEPITEKPAGALTITELFKVIQQKIINGED